MCTMRSLQSCKRALIYFQRALSLLFQLVKIPREAVESLTGDFQEHVLEEPLEGSGSDDFKTDELR